MKLFYASAFAKDRVWGAESFLRNAFHALEHTTYCLDYRANRHKLFGHFLNAPQCDALFLQRGDFFPTTLIKAVQIPKFFWGTELPTRCHDHRHLIRTGLFDHFFLWTDNIIDFFVDKGWVERSQCSVLSGACEPSVHKPLPGVAKDIDVLFVGSMTPRRQAMLAKVGERCSLVTASVFGDEMVHMFNRARIVLNIHADPFLTTESRVFEALGCGSFLLTERLSPGGPFSKEDLVEFDSDADLADKIQHYLAHPQVAERIAKHGHAAVLESHTYTHRARQVIEVMSRYVETHAIMPAPVVKRSLAFRIYGLFEPLLYAGHLLRARGRALASR